MLSFAITTPSTSLSPSTAASWQGLAASSSAQAPLHDIVGPVSFFAYNSTQLLAIFFGLIALGGVIFWIFQRKNKKRALTPREFYLEELLKIKGKIMEGSDDAFGSQVSGVLRSYLEKAFGLATTRQTTEEFLASLHHHEDFTPEEQNGLKDFLIHADLLKFARGKSTEQDRLSFLAAAEHFLLSHPILESKKEKELL